MRAEHISSGSTERGTCNPWLSDMSYCNTSRGLGTDLEPNSMSVERDIRYDLIARLCPNATGAELKSVATEVCRPIHTKFYSSATPPRNLYAIYER